MIAVGQCVEFGLQDLFYGNGAEDFSGKVTGTVVFVNKKHRWFSVVYNDGKSRISFHFTDIGEKVKLYGKRKTAGVP